jgi:hypothetical protein
MVQFIEQFQKVPYASGYSVERSHEHNIEATPPGIGHELIKSWTF